MELVTTEQMRKQAFKCKFDKHYSTLCRIAYGFIANKEECEDIVQETFIAVWNSKKDLLPEDEFAAYMTSSVKNNCITFIRKRRLDTVSIDDVILPPNMLQSDDVEKEWQNHKNNVLDEALSELPAKCKEVFLMNKIRGLRYREIAIVAGISEKTVENHMGKAIKILREYAKTHPLYMSLLTLISIHLMHIKL